MNKGVKEGLGFGITSGIITTLGLVTGLSSGTGLKLAVIGGILTIAISDAISDAYGIHISKESSGKKGKNHQAEVWEATVATFLAKFFVALSFVVPVLFFDLVTAVYVNIAWGLLLVVFFSYHLAKLRGDKPARSIISHTAVFAIVVAITYYAGQLIAYYF